GLAGVGIARRLRAFDFRRQHRRPFGPPEQAGAMEGKRHREALCLPRFTEHRRVVVTARNTGHIDVGRAHAGTRYGSNASMDTVSVGSAPWPHNSVPLNTTV